MTPNEMSEALMRLKLISDRGLVSTTKKLGSKLFVADCGQTVANSKTVTVNNL